METSVNPQILRWLEGRGISGETALRMGVYSGARLGNGGEVVPDARGNLIVFPFVEGGNIVAEKYRGANKQFSQRPNPKKTFFNADILDDEALARGDAALVITEGEMDCLSVVESGYPFAVSVPDGAPPAKDANGNLLAPVPEGADGIDPETDEKYRYVLNNWDRLAKIKRIIIATDNDAPGRRLASELVRRLGRVRCLFVTFPDGCKDFNDVLQQHGRAEVVRIINAAKPYPVSGVHTFSDLPQEPDILPATTGWGRLDPHLMIYHPALMVVTGFAGQGKSTWTQQLVANIAAIHGWNVAIASFEMKIRPFVTDALGAAYLGKGRRFWSFDDNLQVNEWLDRHFCFIAPEPDCERVHDVDWLLEKAETAVIRHGARVLLIDPWNEIEHSRRSNETMTEYTNRAIMQIKAFGRRFDVLVIIVAHPTKGATQKAPEDLSLYDISDSAAFQNKADLGVVIARLGDPKVDNITGIHVTKVRYQPDTGTLGEISVVFDRENRIFSQ